MDHKTRKMMFAEFAKTKKGVLITTDLSTRGLNFENVGYVVQFDLHSQIKEYVNRIGRTARMSKTVS
jgi:superfamily II DNA/RNA helicase